MSEFGPQGRKGSNMPRTANGEPKATVSVMIHIPTALKEILENKAKEDNTSVAAYVRQVVANHEQYALPAMTTRGPKGKYAGMTAEQKKAAQAADQKKNRDTLHAVIAAAKAGKLDLDALLAQFAPPPKAPKTEETAPAEAPAEAPQETAPVSA